MDTNIKFFVLHGYDDDIDVPQKSIYEPICCGATYVRGIYRDLCKDNVNDNISEKFLSYKYLTGQYWIWKNIKAKYYGISERQYYTTIEDVEYTDEYKRYGFVEEECLRDDVIEKYRLTKEYVNKNLSDVDLIIYEEITDVTIRKESVFIPDFFPMMELIKSIKRRSPHLEKFIKQYLEERKTYRYYSFIMRDEIFNEYSAWLFSILFDLENRIKSNNVKLKDHEFYLKVGKILLSIYILYLSSKKELVIKRNQLVFIKNIKQKTVLKPVEKDQVTVMFHFSDSYVNTFSVALASLLRYVNPNRTYEIIVYSQNISNNNKRILQRYVSEKENVKISFYDSFELIKGKGLYTGNNPDYTEYTYLKLIAPFALSEYKKMLMLDSDIIVKCDVAELFDIDLDDKYIGAVRDVVFSGYVNNNQYFVDYSREKLHLQDPYSYFNAGVLVCDCEKIRKKYTVDDVMEVTEHEYLMLDQDALNILYQGHVKFLETAWNCFAYTNGGVKASIESAPLEYYTRYLEARSNPKILHYAAVPKPWHSASSDFGVDFWIDARKSPYYETLLEDMVKHVSAQKEEENIYLRFMFPWDLIELGDRIIIYGGGIVGKTFLKQLAKVPYCHVLGICDRSPNETGIIGVPLLTLDDLSRIDPTKYDTILIAIEREDIAIKIKQDLIEMKIPENKIKWKNPAIKK